MVTGLLLVDIQNDYFHGGAMPLVGSEEAGEKAGQLLAYFRGKKWPVVHVQHVSVRPGASFFLPGTDGLEHHRVVRPAEGEPVIQKHWPNCFRETRLLELLRERGIERLVVAGMMTHMCVDAAVRGAVDHGFRCVTVANACATRDQRWGGRTIAAADVHGSFLAALDGTYGEVLTLAETIALCE